ncbi:NADPH dehydrogenase NamA [Paenibacillus sp. JCM 10914]
MSLLFTPIQIRDVEIKNRVMMSPMGTLSAGSDGKITDWHIVHYGARALGQVGLIMMEATAVQEKGRDEGSIGIWSDDHIESLQKLVTTIHSHGSRAGIQLWHVGRKSNIRGYQVSASGFPYQDRDSRELTVPEIQTVVRDFQLAASRAALAGFDVIELHAAHGYLLNDFLSSYTNRRTDEYGGSFEKRYRLLGEVIEAIRSVWHGPLFVRVSADEYGDIGNRIEDAIQYASKMKEQGVDLIDVSTGGVHPDKPEIYPGYQVPYAKAIKDAVQIPTAAVGLITTGSQAEQILQNMSADLIAVGRALLRDPFWVRNASEEIGEYIEAPKPYLGHWYTSEHAPTHVLGDNL